MNAVEALENPRGPFPDTLFLIGALIFWCDRTLIDEIISAERFHPRTSLNIFGMPILNRDRDLRPASSDDHRIVNHYFGRLQSAWVEAVRDFGPRVQSGELQLCGVEYRGDLVAAPQIIPGAFAMKMRFDFADSTLRLGKRHFLSVKVSRRPFDGSGSQPAVVAPEPVAGAQAAVGPAIMQVRGRQNYTAMIREAANDKWETIHVDGQPADSWTAIAGWLASHLRRKYPDRAQDNRLPTEETIRTRIPETYRKILLAKNVR